MIPPTALFSLLDPADCLTVCCAALAGETMKKPRLGTNDWGDRRPGGRGRGFFDSWVNRDERNAHHAARLALSGWPSELAFCLSAEAIKESPGQGGSTGASLTKGVIAGYDHQSRLSTTSAISEILDAALDVRTRTQQARPQISGSWLTLKWLSVLGLTEG